MVEKGKKVFVFKMSIFLLELTLILNLGLLILLNSNNFEDDFRGFCHKYVVESNLFPIEYRSDISQMDKVIKMIKENLKKYNDIPEFEVFYLDVQMQVFTGDKKITY